MNSPVQLAEKLEEFEDFKRTLKQKSSGPFVKKQEFKFTEKNRRYEAPGKFEYNRKDKKFPASTNYTNITKPLLPSTNLFKDIKTASRKAVIGSDLLEQASISFTKEGVKFNKYENHAQLMQISAENHQIKKELEKLIQDYKPEKTASTDVTMRIILKDEEPVCQPPRRLAFIERQKVNKQIEEWLNEGIIRPSSSEYAIDGI
ncbi:retrovirus-related Pol polyprotein from transposon 412 [Trichonephila clavipes]|nr:retrovirus-related Pol polyprotein from transposon 412 [Trichonephila clavipes]